MTAKRTGLLAAAALALAGVVVPMLPQDGSATRGRSPAGGRLIPIPPHAMPSSPASRARQPPAPGSFEARADDIARRLEAREQDLRAKGIRHQRSPRNILSPENQARIREAIRAKQRRASEAGTLGGDDTLHVRLAAVRISFNEKGRATTAKFDLRHIWNPDRDDTLMIDPPPHDREYYLQQYRALDNFWQAMFYGKIKLDYEVFPLDDSSTYVLDSLSHYAAYDPDSTGGSGRAGGWTTEGLIALVKDALRAGDADSAWRFQDFDVYNIIHAGPDFQTDVNRDSPDDVPSFYAYFGDTLWTDVTDVDSFAVLDATMLPETVSQDGLVGAVNGVFAHEFGHQLGLPDFYDVFTGFPAVGYWELMDSGPNVAVDLGYPVFGVLPAELSACSRYILSTFLTQGGGFLDVEEVPGLWADSLPAIESPPGAGPGKVLKVPLSSEEYYLIENRQDDSDGNRATFVGDSLVILEGVTHYTGPDTLTGALYQEKETGVVLGPSRFAPRDSTGELQPFEDVRSWEYDAALPGHGILIWHVDEEVMFDLSIDSTGWAPNGNPRRRSLALEEADGIPDLGDWRSFYWQGSPYDPFYAGSADSITPTSFPNTNTNLGGKTGLEITHIGSRGHRMFLSIRRGDGEAGFPIILSGEGARGSAASAIATGDLDADGVTDIAVARGGEIFAVHGGAAPADSVILDGFPAASGAAEAGPVSLGDLDGDKNLELIARTAGGKLAAWRANGRPYFDTANPYAVPAFTESLSVNGGPAMLMDLDGDGRDEIVAGAGAELRAYGDDAGTPRLVWSVPGGRMSTTPHSEVVAVAAGDGLGQGVLARVVALLSTGEMALVDAAGRVVGQWAPAGMQDLSAGGFIATGDIDRATDGVPEALVVGRNGLVGLLQATGTFAEGHWPVSLGARIAGPPALGDVDGDGRLEILVPLERTGLAVIRANGVPLQGSPWKAPVAGEASALVVDLEGDGASEALVNGADGLMYGFRGDGRLIDGWPVGIGRGPLTAASLVNLRTDDPDPELAVLDGVGALGLIELPGWSGTGSVQWAEAFGDGARRSHFSGALGSPVDATVFASEEGVYVYPNPAREANPRIRVELGGDADAVVRIFSLAGDEVTSWSGRMERPVDEFEWDVSHVASGLYLARIQLTGEGHEMSFIRKIAVMR